MYWGDAETDQQGDTDEASAVKHGATDTNSGTENKEYWSYYYNEDTNENYEQDANAPYPHPPAGPPEAASAEGTPSVPDEVQEAWGAFGAEYFEAFQEAENAWAGDANEDATEGGVYWGEQNPADDDKEKQADEGADAQQSDTSKSEWQGLYDEQGNVYYWNSQTGESKWECPEEWCEIRDEEGNVYYENQKTFRSTWTKPKRFVGISLNVDAEADYNGFKNALYSPGERKMMNEMAGPSPLHKSRVKMQAWGSPPQKKETQ